MSNIVNTTSHSGAGEWWADVPKAAAASVWTLAAVLIVTYLVSTMRGTMAVRNKDVGGRPPMLPYLVPLIGHVPEFVWNMEGFLSKAT